MKWRVNDDSTNISLYRTDNRHSADQHDPDCAVGYVEEIGGRVMKTALWIIAICEVVRAVQNMVQIMTIKHDTKGRDNAYAEFVKSLKMSDREWVRRTLEEFEEQEGE